ncbi:hypothetical protein [Pseudoalteromonas shioyasakiensis]|nr:hypothetical protein [Pseudoalteromonas shioyasakiensis]
MVFKTRQASVTPTFDVGVKFISRDVFVLSGVQDAPSKRDAYD